MSTQKTVANSWREWGIPLFFIFSASWVVWHLPAYMLDWFPPENPSNFDRLSGQFLRNDASPGLGGIFGGYVDIIDFVALVGVPVLMIWGIRTVKQASMEHFEWNVFDKISIFLGRVTMMLVAILLTVMIYEVVLRYVFERPTLWANELSLWIAGFVFLLAGLYAMQQRSHIRIFIIYDLFPRWGQRACDVVSTTLIVLFVMGLIWGGYREAHAQFFRWETFGTAFDPPIPATLSPMILIATSLVAFQAIVNLIRDWDRLPEHHTAADDIDEEEIAALKRVLGEDNNA